MSKVVTKSTEFIGPYPIDLYSAAVPSKKDVLPTLVVPGLGEERFSSIKLAKKLAIIGHPAVVAVLNFPDKESIDYVCKGALGHVAKLINLRHGRDEDGAVNTVSHSQGGGIMLLAANGAEQFAGGRHAIIAPVGINSPDLGESLNQRLVSLGKQYIITNTFFRNQLRPENWSIALDLINRLGYDVVGSMITTGHPLVIDKLNYALSDKSHELGMNGLAELALHASVAVFAGIKDPIFPYSEIEAQVRARGDLQAVRLLHVAGAHEAMYTKLGFDQVQSGISFLSQTPTAA